MTQHVTITKGFMFKPPFQPCTPLWTSLKFLE